MKKAATLLALIALDICACQAYAQAVVAAAPATAGATAMSKTPGKLSEPRPPIVKDFNAARTLQIENSKFHRDQLDKLAQCLESAKSVPDLHSCQATYRGAMAANLTKQIEQGKYSAAYENAPGPAPKATAAPSKH